MSDGGVIQIVGAATDNLRPLILVQDMELKGVLGQMAHTGATRDRD